MHLITKEISAFNEIVVYETNELYGEQGDFRCLKFADDAIQGAVDLKSPKRVVLTYQRALLQLMELNNPWFNKVFVIGHGTGTIAGYYSDRNFIVAEIDERVVELSRVYFGYKKDNVRIGDGRQLLEAEASKQMDYVIVDAFTHKGTPLHFTTKEFFDLIKEKLKADGSVLLNIMGRTKNDRFMNAIHSTLSRSFNHIKAFALSDTAETELRNILLLASNEPISSEDYTGAGKVSGFKEVELEQGHIRRD